MAPANKKAKEESAAALDDPTLAAVIRKALRRDRKWTLVLIGVITGLIWGFYVDGATGLIAGIAIMTGITALFVQTYLRIDDEAYGGLGSLLLDSAYVAIAAFLVTWTLTHSVLFGDELSDALKQDSLKAAAEASLPPPVQEL